MRDRDDVLDVLIEVQDLGQPDGCPSTDTIWFITTADPQQVGAWFPKRFTPSEVAAGFDDQTEPYALPPQAAAVYAWYD